VSVLHGATVLVTGGAGFIGSELVRQLVQTGAKVTVIDDFVNGKRENLVDAGVLTVIEGDVRDRSLVTKAMKSADVVFHLACLGVRHSIHSPSENHSVNAGGTLVALEAALESRVGRFVCVSSSEVYGDARSVAIDESHPTLPHTVYGAAKLAGEAYARAYHTTYGLPTVIVRPFNSYGPRSHHEGDAGEVVPKFMLRAMAGQPLVVFGDGLQTRDMTYVQDTARGILTAGYADDAVGETINIGSGREIRVIDLARAVGVALGKDLEIVHAAARPGDVRRLMADSGKARSLLGFTPTVPLAEGLVRLRDWYLSQPASPEQLLESELVANWERQVG